MIRRLLTICLAVGLMAGFVAACGGDDDDGGNADATTTTRADEEETTTTTESDSFDPDSGDDEEADDAVDEFSADVTDEGDEYTDFVSISDDSGSISVEVPVEWSDVDGSPNSSGDPSLRAGPDLGAPIEEVPVLGYTAVETADPEGQDLDGLIDAVADASTGGECTADTPQDYSDPLFTGRIQAFTDCGGDDRAWLFVAATPDNGDDFVAVIFGQAVTVADVDAIQHAFDTFTASL